MVKSIPTSGIRDNHTRGIVADFLKSNIKEGSNLSIVSAFFTIYAYEALKDHLNQIGHMGFLVYQFREENQEASVRFHEDACLNLKDIEDKKHFHKLPNSSKFFLDKT